MARDLRCAWIVIYGTPLYVLCFCLLESDFYVKNGARGGWRVELCIVLNIERDRMGERERGKERIVIHR